MAAETGFSQSPRTTGDTRADLLSWGVVVENTSGRYIVFGSELTVRLLDAEGNQIDEIDGEPTNEPISFLPQLTRVLPGERVGFGRTTPHYGADVADIEVEIETGAWQEAVADQWWAQPIAATDVTTHTTGVDATLSFAVNAGYTADMIRGQLWIGGDFAAIFRDSGGAIVGGADCCPGTSGAVTAEVPPGDSQAGLLLEYGMPTEADDARTEIYLPNPQERLPG